MGIPVDGNVEEFREQLIEKGFKPWVEDGQELLRGYVYNGYCDVILQSHQGKIYEVDALYRMDYKIGLLARNNFNFLVSMFKEKGYFTYVTEPLIPEDKNPILSMLDTGGGFRCIFFKPAIGNEEYIRDGHDKLQWACVQLDSKRLGVGRMYLVISNYHNAPEDMKEGK